MRTVALWLVLKLRGIHIGTEEVGVGLVVIPAETQLFLRSSRACLGNRSFQIVKTGATKGVR
eukprot:COSAG06_NODE_33044_length_496_cov_0.831234_1_plen_61_part_10